MSDADPPASARAVLHLIAERFGELPPQLQRAARYVSDQPREVGVQSMRALATRAAAGRFDCRTMLRALEARQAA